MKKLLAVLILAFALFLIGCDSESSNDPQNGNTDIPADPVNVTVPQPVMNNIQPTATFSQPANNPSRVLVNMQGIINPTTGNPVALVYNASNPSGSNVFLEQDGVVKGLKVTKVSTGNVLLADVVFTVDNSGSMSEEADSVAAGIIEFAQFLQASGLDVKFGIVGYDGNVNGAINFTDAASIQNYLNRYQGTSRTSHFAGADSANLVNAARNFASGVWGENGVVGVLFADSVFGWRGTAQRVFVNFTDEPTQPDGNLYWNTARMCSKISGRATVHTVFSQDSSYYSWSTTSERPWAMSWCTGGTVEFLDRYATGLDLRGLPVAGALANSYLVEFVKGDSEVKGRMVVITVKEQGADGKQTYNTTY